MTTQIVRAPEDARKSIPIMPRAHYDPGDGARSSGPGRKKPWRISMRSLQLDHCHGPAILLADSGRRLDNVDRGPIRRGARSLCHQGRLSDAEQKLRAALARDPHHQLSHFSTRLHPGNHRPAAGRAVPHRLELVQGGEFTAETLVLLGDVERVLNDGQLLKLSREDGLPMIRFPGWARPLWHSPRTKWREAQELLESVVESLPA